MGSCGTDATEADFVAALSKVLFDASGTGNANNNPYCGRMALVKAASGSKNRKKRWGRMNLGPITESAQSMGNRTSGFEDWERSRSEKASRRGGTASSDYGARDLSAVQNPIQKARLKKRLLVPTPARNISELSGKGTASQQEDGEGTRVLPPGITPAPDAAAARRELDRRQAGGGGVTITVIDRCPVCGQYDLDLSPAAFDVIGNEDDGRIEISWHWLDG